LGRQKKKLPNKPKQSNGREKGLIRTMKKMKGSDV